MSWAKSRDRVGISSNFVYGEGWLRIYHELSSKNDPLHRGDLGSGEKGSGTSNSRNFWLHQGLQLRSTCVLRALSIDSRCHQPRETVEEVEQIEEGYTDHEAKSITSRSGSRPGLTSVRSRPHPISRLRSVRLRYARLTALRSR